MIGPLEKYNLRVTDARVDPEVHKTKEAQQLRDACQQFESILWAKLWKQMRDTARAIGGERERPWKQMEDLSLEMASDELAASPAGPGLWKMLYDSTIAGVAANQKSVSASELNAQKRSDEGA